ncbi:MAG: alpha/beta hydrolase [Pseudomonadota bacterium]
MNRIAALIAAAQLALLASPISAQVADAKSGGQRTVITQSWVEEWDPVQGRWVKVADHEPTSHAEALPTVVTTIINGQAVSEARSGTRYARPINAESPAMTLAQYGPFVVANSHVARMVGSTNALSPQHFDAMLRDFPGITMLEMVEAPGTTNDIANLAVGRKIRAAGISTHVPRGGSVRSGAVELFLAGAMRTMDDSATFAVHSWLDNHGRQADDFAADHLAHRLYLDYYAEMGMSERQAREFYAMTNSVPHASALWLNAQDMRGWITPTSSVPHRFAARKVEATCTFCDRVEARLAETNARIAAMSLKPIALNMVSPMIGYGDLTELKLAWGHMSSLDS